MNKKNLDILIEAVVNVGSDQLTQQQIDFVNAVARGQNNSGRRVTYKWNVVDGEVKVFGEINLSYHSTPHLIKLTHLPVQFSVITDKITITGTDLADLTGLPDKTFGDLHISDNNISNLRGCPSTIQGNFNCAGNKLTSLSNFPKVRHYCIIDDNPYQLNDQLFEDIKAIGGKAKIVNYRNLLTELKKQIPVQFGIDKPRIINQIWKSYTNILEAK